MLIGPLVYSFIPGVIILMLTWWLTKKKLPLFVKLLPSIITFIAVVVLFYIGYVKVRGWEGAAYLFLAFFLTIFAIISFMIGKKLKPSS
ncbi:YesK family protein [Cytobacillus sp. Hz8]|uniref:YesK family protein n=1 Tax=Cytobacillus sp. Hz8 TaxID=3347168 RepID=UPI0035D850E0